MRFLEAVQRICATVDANVREEFAKQTSELKSRAKTIKGMDRATTVAAALQATEARLDETELLVASERRLAIAKRSHIRERRRHDEFQCWKLGGVLVPLYKIPLLAMEQQLANKTKQLAAERA